MCAIGVQGALDNCWLIAALKLVASSTHYWKLTKLLAGEDPADPNVVRGQLRFGGLWRSITVLKTLPATRVEADRGDEETKRELIYAHPCALDATKPVALWAAFAEKMFAVAYGGYTVRTCERASVSRCSPPTAQHVWQ